MPILRARRTAGLFLAAAMTLPLAGHALTADDVDPQWLNEARAICQPRNGDKCDDIEYLQEHYSAQVLSTRKTALRAATRSNRAEERAKREVLLQYAGVCDDHVEKYCAGTAACSSRAAQICLSLKQRAAACRLQSKQFCAQQRVADCRPLLARCPSEDSQDIEKILARHDDLTPAQKSRIRQLAQQLKETDNASAIGSIVNSLLTVLGLAVL